MAFTNCFLNFNINFSWPNFGFNFGCFSMPNFFSNMPLFNCNSFSTILPFQQYSTPMNFNIPSVFSAPNFNMPTMNFNNTNLWKQGGFNFNFNSNFDSFNYSNKSTQRKDESKGTTSRTYGSLQEKYYKTGLSFVGKINSDREGNARFSKGRSNQWCADFASMLAIEVFGDKLQSGFPDERKHGISTMAIKSWGEKHNRYLDLPSNGIADYIAKNVKAGDIMIVSRGGGKGHTAIVTKVNSDGTFETVDGNSGNAVKNRKRQPKVNQNSKGSAKLIGFVQMGDIA